MTTMNESIQSSKEAAYLFDLSVAETWGESFYALLDENLKLPQKGSLLYVLSGTGNHILKMRDSAPDELKFVAIEPDEEKAALASAKIEALRAPIMLRVSETENLPFDDDSFEVVICEASMNSAEALPALLSELQRVAVPSATLRLTTVTAGSYGEVISLLWEAVFRTGLRQCESAVESLVTRNITTAKLEEMGGQAGWRSVETETRSEIFSFESDEEFFNAPLITHYLMPYWTGDLADAVTDGALLEELKKIYLENTDNLDFQFTVKATVLKGRK